MNKRRNKASLALLLTISIFLTTAVYSAPVSADTGSPPADAAYVPGRIVVKFKKDFNSAHVAQLHASQGATVVDEIPKFGVQILSVPPGEVETRIAAYKANPSVEYAEPDYLAQPAYEPNDPSYGNGTQWGPQKISAPQAWDFCKGASNVVIAVLDWGVDLQHPDLATEMWTNSGEIPDNGIDDDGNDYIDDVYGWDFANDDNDPQDDYGHGTHCAGITAAATDNGVGIAGVAFNSHIMAVKVGDGTTGLAAYSDVASGIMYAAGNGAKVINLSLGGDTPSGFLEAVVNYAWEAGCVLVGAAGNGNTSASFYPAAYANVIGVSGTDQNDAKASWSNYGAQVAVAAPGVSIYSTYWWNGDSIYANMSGTSMAAPHVAGLAALLFSQDGGRSSATVRSLIEGSADDLGDAGWDQYYGYGRINAYRALMSAVIEPGTGGSLSPDGADLALNFPSVTITTTVTYMPDDAPNDPPGGSVFANDPFTLEATDAEGNSVSEFDSPYTLTLYYEDSDLEDQGIEESTLDLYHWNGNDWEAVGCSLDTVNNELVAVLNHFSEFGLMGEGGSPTAVTLSSFAARSGTDGSVSPLWLGLAGLTVLAAGSLFWAKRRD